MKLEFGAAWLVELGFGAACDHLASMWEEPITDLELQLPESNNFELVH